MTWIEVLTHERDNICVGTLRGEIDLANATSVTERLLAGVTKTSSGLVIDLSGVEYLDSAGINLLFELNRRLRVRQQRLMLVVPAAACVHEVLRMSQVLAAIPAEESVAAAAAVINGPNWPTPGDLAVL